MPESFSLTPEGQVVRSLWLLTEGDVAEFVDYQRPPTGIRSFIRRADAPMVHGLLITILQRWHEVRQIE